MTAQARNFPLKKPGGFHWDLFLLGCTSFIAGIVDIPLPNGLVPQAPVHTESLTDYRAEVKIIKTVDGQEIRQMDVIADRVVEQRVSHLLMGLAIIGTMTGPLLIVLNLMPIALFGGVFFVVGVSLSHNQHIPKELIYLSLSSGAVLKATALPQKSCISFGNPASFSATSRFCKYRRSGYYSIFSGKSSVSPLPWVCRRPSQG